MLARNSEGRELVGGRRHGEGMVAMTAMLTAAGVVVEVSEESGEMEDRGEG